MGRPDMCETNWAEDVASSEELAGLIEGDFAESFEIVTRRGARNDVSKKIYQRKVGQS